MPVEVEEKLRQRVTERGGYVDFSGKNCDDFGDCSGWDGESRRCACGNRRVAWELRFKGDPNNPDDYYAEAY